MATKIEKTWQQEDLFKRSFDEYTECIKAVLKEAEAYPSKSAAYAAGICGETGGDTG